MRKRRLRTVFSYLFTFFIAFFVFVMVLLTVTKYTVLSSSYFLKQMDAVDYYANTAMQLNQMIKQNAVPAGLPSEMFENYIQEEDIRSDMITYEEALIAKQEAQVSTASIKQRLQRDITSYASEKKITLTNTMQTGIDNFIKTIEDKYQYLTQFPYFHVYVSMIHIFSTIYWIVMPIVLLATGVLIFFVYRLHGGWRRRRRYYAYAFIGGGLLTSALPMYLYSSRFIEKINLSPQYLYDLMVSMMKTYLSYNIMIGMVIIVVGVVCAFVSIKQKKQETKRYYPSDKLLEGIERV